MCAHAHTFMHMHVRESRGLESEGHNHPEWGFHPHLLPGPKRTTPGLVERSKGEAGQNEEAWVTQDDRDGCVRGPNAQCAMLPGVAGDRLSKAVVLSSPVLRPFSHHRLPAYINFTLQRAKH